MNLFLALTIAVIAIAVIIFIELGTRKKIRKNSDPKQQQETSNSSFSGAKKEERFFKVPEEISKVIDNLKETQAIRPEGNQQRNLDREIGGLEAEEQKESSAKDIWDERSEEIDRAGAIDQLGSTGKKSMIWRKKKEKLDEKKREKAMDASEAHRENQKQGTGTNYDSRYSAGQGGFMTMVKARTDHGNGGGRGL